MILLSLSFELQRIKRLLHIPKTKFKGQSLASQIFLNASQLCLSSGCIDLVSLLFTFTNSSDQHAAIKSRMLKLPDGLWNCADCGYSTSYQTTIWKHIEAKHVAQPAPCLYCDKMCPSKNALASHVSRYHRAKKITQF